MDLCLFILYYLLCTIVLLTILTFIFKKYLANKLISMVIKQAFDNTDIDTDIVNLTETLNDMNTDSQNSNDMPKFF